MAAALFAGKWKLESSENFDKYMQAVGKTTFYGLILPYTVNIFFLRLYSAKA